MKKFLIVLVALMFITAVLLIIGKENISTDIIINAPTGAVWEELTDFNAYPDWNPFLRKVNGEIKKGNTIEVTFQGEGDDPMVFTPVILQNEKNKVFQWEGKFIMAGIFTGRHTFELSQVEGSKTRLVQREEFNGILVPFFSFESTIEGFNSMNRELKKRVESK